MSNNFFTMRVEPVDRAMLKELAKRIGRTQSDAVRVVIREVVTALREEERARVSGNGEKNGTYSSDSE